MEVSCTAATAYVRDWTGGTESSSQRQCIRHQLLKKQIKSQENTLCCFSESVARTSLLALVSASLFFVDPVLAYKGGGPYGSEVTRGQDLTGKDFSGKTLIKQDFKTGVKLLGASFFDADLTGADLSESDLRGADFSLANVTKVNLSNANLEGALTTGNTSFKGSNINGAVMWKTTL
ncbi:hypothetical protein LWI28_014629 [Acer negundo]|uniref:Uncharacterized protein n=1 Tax=Acer negundo TaxID=4023 RepID=A0AAD5I9H1_ACENE|nr:hypothetical protein LWI28_014629 [Acer negundo]